MNDVRYLKLEDHVAHGFEGVGLLGSSAEAVLAPGTGASDLAEERLNEVGGDSLIRIAIRRCALVQNPHDALNARSIFFGYRTGAVHEKRFGP